MPAGRLDHLPEVVWELRHEVVELAAGQRLAQRGQYGPDVIADLSRGNTGARADAALELLDVERLGLGGARPECLLEPLRELGRDVLSLTGGQPVGERLERCV